MPARALNCPDCSRVLSPQGLPNHMRFMHGKPTGAPPPSRGVGTESAPQGKRMNGQAALAAILVIVAAAVVVYLAVTYALMHCSNCDRWSVVARGSSNACPKCGQAWP